MNKKKIYWICQAVGWGFLYLPIVVFFDFIFQTEKFDLNGVIIQVFTTIFYLALSHAYRWVILKLGWLEYWWLKLTITIAFSILMLGVISFVLSSLFELLSGNEVDLSRPAIFFGVSQPAGIYFFWSVIYFTFHYFERYNKSLQYEAAINEFEINNLKAQMNPHFIFNALNSIRALVDENPNKSKTAITRLSNILRSSLILDKKKLISFKDELTTVKDYLELESIRYEERLRFFFHIAPESFDFNVPPMMIQTIIENGIKHGVSKLTKGGEIALKTQVINHTLLIQVRNSGQYKSSKNDTNSGFGLKNTIKRLHLIYGEEASFSIKNESDDTVLTEIVIPETI